jgi:diguanylate cyclase (GGDEF)-like protein
MVAAAAVSAALVGFLLGAAWMGARLRRTRAELTAARWLADHDPLTGLPNRCWLKRHYQSLAAAGTPPAAILFDLDDFKRVNDTWGHQAGDAHLAAVADRLAQACATIGAVVGRLAGDEFLVLLPRATAEDAIRSSETVLGALKRPTMLPVGDRGLITVIPAASAGIALPEAASTWTELLQRADIALYNAKLQRGNAVLHTLGMCQPGRLAQPAPGDGPKTAGQAAYAR